MELLKGMRENQMVFIPNHSNNKKFIEIKGNTKFPGIYINHHMSMAGYPKNY